MTLDSSESSASGSGSDSDSENATSEHYEADNSRNEQEQDEEQDLVWKEEQLQNLLASSRVVSFDAHFVHQNTISKQN